MGLNDFWLEIIGAREVACLVTQNSILFQRSDSYQIVEELIKRETRILGLEGFEYRKGEIVALPECIVDFDEKISSREDLEFLRKVLDGDDFARADFVEIVVG